MTGGVARAGPTAPSRRAKLAVIFSLYMAQGTATGFLVAGLPSVLRDQGLPLGLLWIASLPPIFYSIKFIWAPLADRHWLPALGRRRTWLIPATLGVSGAFLALSLFPPDRGLLPATIALLFIGLAGANMDIATDAYAVELLLPEERGLGNGVQSAGLACGVMIGEGAMLILVDHVGWPAAMLALGVLIPLIAAPALLRREPPVTATPLAADRPALRVFFRRPEALAVLGLALFTGLCYYLVAPILGPFLVDRGLSLTTIGTFGMLGTGVGIVGALAGGASVNVLGFRRAYATILVGGALFAGLSLAVAAGNIGAPLVLGSILWLGRFLLGAAFAVFYANVMNWCSPHQAATDYTMISSVYSATAVIGGSLAFVSAAQLGYAGYFAAVAAFHLVALAVFRRLHPRVTAGSARALGVAEHALVERPGAGGRAAD